MVVTIGVLYGFFSNLLKLHYLKDKSQNNIAAEFTSKLKIAIAELKVGDGFTDGITTGPLVNEQAVVDMEALIADARDKGVTVEMGGNRHALPSESGFSPGLPAPNPG